MGRLWAHKHDLIRTPSGKDNVTPSGIQLVTPSGKHTSRRRNSFRTASDTHLGIFFLNILINKRVNIYSHRVKPIHSNTCNFNSIIDNGSDYKRHETDKQTSLLSFTSKTGDRKEHTCDTSRIKKRVGTHLGYRYFITRKNAALSAAYGRTDKSKAGSLQHTMQSYLSIFGGNKSDEEANIPRNDKDPAYRYRHIMGVYQPRTAIGSRSKHSGFFSQRPHLSRPSVNIMTVLGNNT